MGGRVRGMSDIQCVWGAQTGVDLGGGVERGAHPPEFFKLMNFHTFFNKQINSNYVLYIF